MADEVVMFVLLLVHLISPAFRFNVAPALNENALLAGVVILPPFRLHVPLPPITARSAL